MDVTSHYNKTSQIKIVQIIGAFLSINFDIVPINIWFYRCICFDTRAKYRLFPFLRSLI